MSAEKHFQLFSVSEGDVGCGQSACDPRAVIRLSSPRDPSAKSPIEIKVAGSWSLRQLADALTVQMRGRYLRDKDNRFGILLVVHNTVRAKGWRQGSRYLKFAEAMAQLEAIAREMAAVDALAPQIIPVGINLSHFAQCIKTAEVEKAVKLAMRPTTAE
jgi:hypothetical protein